MEERVSKTSTFTLIEEIRRQLVCLKIRMPEYQLSEKNIPNKFKHENPKSENQKTKNRKPIYNNEYKNS